MKNKTNYIILSIGFILLSCASNKNINIDKKSMLKEYAYCKCLQHALNDSLIFKNDLSIAVYEEVINYDTKAYEIIDSVAKKIAKNITPSIIADHKGKKSAYMNCFMFYNSKSLDSVIKSIEKYKMEDW